jgi:1-acyl-sn-glycerol-3-phosphate acyltransferase
MGLLNSILNVLLWAYFISTSIVLFVGAFLIWLLTFFWDTNRKILQQYSCFWSSIYIWGNPFWSVQVSGKENVDPHHVYVMASNHKSLMDILVLFRSFLHFKWVSKASMFKAPLLGWNMRLNGYIPILRGDPQSREKCMAHCKSWLTKGSSVLFFPEGTRSADGTMGKFKLGAFRLALETGTDVLPILIVGSEKAVPKHSLRLTSKAEMKIHLLPPISVKGYDPRRLEEEAARLAETVYQALQGALRALEIAA